MAGLTGRMSTVVKAKVSKLLDRAEDPAETLDYSYQKQVEQLQNVKKGIADVVTAKKRLQMQESSLQQSLVKLDTQARQALSPANEELARAALERKNVAQTELQSLDTQVTELEAQQQKLTDSEQNSCAPRSKPSAPRRRSSRRSTPPPRRRCGSPRPQPASASRWPTSGSRCSARSTRPKTCARAPTPSRSSKRPAPSTTSPSSAPGEDDIDRQLKQLSSQSAVDDELAKMKGELGARPRGRGRRRSPPARALPARRERPAMIVRISGEGQFELADERGRRGSTSSSPRSSRRSRRATRPRSRRRSRRCSTTSAQSAAPVADDELEGSDLILPPADTSLEEAESDFTGEGLIPD